MNITMKKSSGQDGATFELPDEFFDKTPNISLLNQVVLAQLAAARQGTQSAKSRNEVSGGGKKPWAQKGTGNARAGSSRSPIWRGGGMTHAVKPRKYGQKTPKKMIRAALLQALSDRAQDNKIVIIENWDLETPKTKDALKTLKNIGVRSEDKNEKLPRVLVVVDKVQENVWLSLRNIGDQVQLISIHEINAYDVLCSDIVIFSKDTIELTIAMFKGQHNDIAFIESDLNGALAMEDIVDAGVKSMTEKPTKDGGK